ncbi:MAG: PqiC family protein [Mailhella sp.]|nr:PqiC family protein [Mailhella sp.]
MRTMIAAAAMAALLAGCSLPGAKNAPDAHWYVLDAPAAVQPSAARVEVVPAVLPGYLGRPQIVEREGGVSPRIHDFDRWGEELGSGFTRVLCAGLAKEGVSAAVLRQGVSAPVRLKVEVRRFEGSVGGAAMLEADWEICTAGTCGRRGTFAADAPAGGSIASMIEAESALIAGFARDLAARLR